MTTTRFLRICISMATCMVASIVVHAQVQNADCWPSFRGNAQLTGNAPVRLEPPFKLLWTFKTGDAIKSSPVICNGIVYIGSNDGYIYAITSNGKLKWKFNAGNSVESPPLIAQNTIYAGSLEGILFAIDAKTGSLKWKYKTCLLYTSDAADE